MKNKNIIQEKFSIPIHVGKGYYETGIKNTFWLTLNITAKIFEPQQGFWTIIVRDTENKNLIVYEINSVLPNKEISFKYKTGFKINLTIETIWNESKDTNLSGEILIG